MKETLKKYDIITKILSVFAAIILWIYVMNSINPVQTMSYNGFTVQLQGEEQILNAYSLSVIDGEKSTASIKITGTRNQLLSMKTSEVKVVADISGLTESGTYEVPYTVQLPNSLLSVESKTPKTISVTVDKIVSKSIKIESVVKGSSGKDYLYKDPELSDTSLTITGPESEIDKVDHAEIIVAADNLTYNLKHDYDIMLLNAKGNEVHSPNITKSISAITVNMPVYQKKSLTLRADVNYTSDITEDQVSLSFSPKSVTVYGSESALKDLSSLTVAKIDISKYKNGDTIDFTVDLPDNVYLLDDGDTSGKITIQINSETTKSTKTTETTKTIAVTTINLTDTAAEGQGKNTTLLTDSLDITLKGLESTLDAVSTNDITASVSFDSSTLEAGTQNVPVQITIDQTDVEVEGEYTVKIEVEDM